MLFVVLVAMYYFYVNGQPVLLLRAVTTTRLFSVFNTQRILGTSDDLISHTWQIANTAATDENNRVLLQIVAFTGDVHRNFFAIGKSDAGNLAKGRIRLLRSHRTDLQTNTLFLGASFQDRGLGELAFLLSSLTEKLVNRGHSFFYLSRRCYSVALLIPSEFSSGSLAFKNTSGSP